MVIPCFFNVGGKSQSSGPPTCTSHYLPMMTLSQTTAPFQRVLLYSSVMRKRDPIKKLTTLQFILKIKDYQII